MAAPMWVSPTELGQPGLNEGKVSGVICDKRMGIDPTLTRRQVVGIYMTTCGIDGTLVEDRRAC